MPTGVNSWAYSLDEKMLDTGAVPPEGRTEPRTSPSIFMCPSGYWDEMEDAYFYKSRGERRAASIHPEYTDVRYWLKGFYDGRHLRTINGVFFDGHVKNIDLDSAWHYKNLAYSSSRSMFNILK